MVAANQKEENKNARHVSVDMIIFSRSIVSPQYATMFFQVSSLCPMLPLFYPLCSMDWSSSSNLTRNVVAHGHYLWFSLCYPRSSPPSRPLFSTSRTNGSSIDINAPVSSLTPTITSTVSLASTVHRLHRKQRLGDSSRTTAYRIPSLSPLNHSPTLSIISRLTIHGFVFTFSSVYAPFQFRIPLSLLV